MTLFCLSASFVLSSLFKPTVRQQLSKLQVVATCFVLATLFCTAAETASAQSKIATSASLAITSGGSTVSSIASGNVVTLTAKVQAGGTAVSPGQVNFCDATAKACADIHLLGTAQLSSAGTATLKLRPGIGSHSYKAVFLGTNTEAGSASGASALTVTGKYSTFTTIQQLGSPGSYTLTATVAGVTPSPTATAPTGNVSFIDTANANTVVATAPVGSGTTTLEFTNSSNPATVSEPNAVATADFNGDGIPDIAVSNSNSGATTLTILLGNGDGTFTATSTSPTAGLYPDSIAVGDFNQDGISDLAVSSVDDDTVTVLLGIGDGTFSDAPALDTLSTPQSVATGDFNGDGIPDLAVVNASSVLIFLGNGDGTFTQTPSSSDPGASAITVSVGDFNRDGVADLAVTNGTTAGYVTILLGNGDGTFRAGAGPLAVGDSAVGLAVADLNGDGIQDLAVTNYQDSGVNICLGNGDGTFQPAVFYTIRSLSARSVLAADFNGDGIADLAIGAFWAGGPPILMGNGDGTFGTPILLPVNIPLSSGYIASADFNGDGIPDLVEPNGDVSGTAVVLLAQPSQTVTATVDNVSPLGPNPLVEASYPGDSNYSGSVSSTTSLTSVVAMPVISPSSGTYTSIQTVTISDSTPGATIYYLASGVFYTSGWVRYTGPISLSIGGQETISAYAAEDGYSQSNATTATFALNFPVAPAPVISPAGGSFAGAQAVTITDSAAGATIYYTTNGSVPTPSSTVYSGPITVSASEAVAAIAAGGGYSPSPATTAQFFIQSSQSRFIYTAAGNGFWGFAGDGGAATQATLNDPYNTAIDAAGNTYIADAGNQVVRKVDAASGTISTVAGTGVAGYSGDGGPASSAQLSYPYAVAVDSIGNLYISDEGNRLIRRVDATTGVITTYAGSLGAISLGDGGPATSAQLLYPEGIAFDNAGNLYIGDETRVRMVNASTGIISTVAGNGYYGFSGDGGLAASASLAEAEGVALDSSGNLYIADTGNNVVRKVTAATGIITTVAGQGGYGYSGYSGDGGPATSAQLNYPQAVAVDSVGNIYITDTENDALREVTTDGNINTISGHPYTCAGLSGDGGPAVASALCWPTGISVDSHNNLYITEEGSGRVRKITSAVAPPSTTAAQPAFSVPAGTYVDPQTLTITDATPGAEIYVTINGAAPIAAGQGYFGPINITGSATIQAVAVAPGYLPSDAVSAAYTITTPPTAIIHTYAGNGTTTASGIGGPATSRGLAYPTGVATDDAGNLYIADENNFVVWMVSAATGNISAVAGIPGVRGYYSPGYSPAGPATSTALSSPDQVAVEKAGNLYIADPGITEVLRVDAKTGIMTVYAGGGQYTPSRGDGGPATQAYLAPDGLAFDQTGNLYISDILSSRIREVSAATGIISTVAGGGSGGLGDGGPATSATFVEPGPIVFDSKGNLYIGDQAGRVRVVDAKAGTITTFAGNGNAGATGDGGAATAAEVSPNGLAVDSADNLYIANYGYGVRMVPAGGGTITRVAGAGYNGFSGDGGVATMAEFCGADALAFDKAGSLYIADVCNYRVRKITYPGPTATPAFSLAAGTYTGAQTVTISDATQGAAIYYTTDGSMPTTGANLYDAPITVSSSEIINAIAVATGYTVSEVASAGYVIKPKVTPVITWPTPAPISYGTPLGSAQLDATSPVAGVFVYTPASGTVLKAGTQTLGVTFTPTDTANYTAATATVTLVVNQAAPALTWTTPAAITYETALSATQLNATSSVVGAFTYTPALGTVLKAGGHTLSVTFTPADTVNYVTATKSVNLTVNKAVPAISWPAPVAISYGTALSGTQLNATSTVAGSFAYTPALGTVPAVGTQTLNTTFTPTDAADYTNATATQTLVVNKAMPSIKAVQSSLNPIMTGSGVTFTASVSSNVGSPSGTITFMNGTVALGTVALNDGTATYTAAALATGPHSITAAYSGDNNFAAVTSAAFTQYVESFSIASPNGSQSVTAAPGGQAIFALAVAPPVAGSPLTFSVTGLPTGATGIFSPSTVAAGAGYTDVILTVDVPPSTSGATTREKQPLQSGRWPAAILALVLLPFARKLRKTSRRWLSLLLLMVIGLTISFGLSACAGGSSNQPKPSHAYSLTVTATSGTLTQTTHLKLIVQE